MSTPKRTKEIKVRATEAELSELRQRSTKPRLAEWMREHCLSDEKRSTRHIAAADPQLLRQLAGIGNNLNQIARRVNRGEWAALDRVVVVAQLERIEKELAQLREQACDRSL